jgi:ribose 5-phosphate isomerase A
MDLRRQAAQKALDYVESGMVLGLGTGRTTSYFVEMLGKRIRAGDFHNILGVPTSDATAQRARELDIPLTTLSEHPRLDLAVDGADDVDPQLDLIKGLGRALTREKIVEIRAERFLVIVDESKLVTRLGEKNPLPVEILPFEANAHIHWLNSLGCRAESWYEDDGSPVVTDNGNYLARCWFPGGIPDAYELARSLAEQPGIVEHGLFLDMASMVIVATEKGVRIMERE